MSDERYANDPELQGLSNSLAGVTITYAKIVEASGICVLKLFLDDSRIIEVGVTGSLYDEAYFVFTEIP